MKKVYFPIISRGPEIEPIIGILIILFFISVILFCFYSAYQKVIELENKQESVEYFKNK